MILTAANVDRTLLIDAATSVRYLLTHRFLFWSPSRVRSAILACIAPPWEGELGDISGVVQMCDGSCRRTQFLNAPVVKS